MLLLVISRNVILIRKTLEKSYASFIVQIMAFLSSILEIKAVCKLQVTFIIFMNQAYRFQSLKYYYFVFDISIINCLPSLVILL